MDWIPPEDNVRKRIQAMCERYQAVNDGGIYFYNMPVSELRGGSRVVVNGREMNRVSEFFLYNIDLDDLQNPELTSCPSNGSFLRTAPVNAPFSWPNSSLSRSVSGMAPQ